MSQNQHIPSPDCTALAPLLPLAAHDLLSEAENARLRAHLATCPRCQTELAVYDQVEAALRRSFAPRQGARPPFSREEIMQTLDSPSDHPIEHPTLSAPPLVPTAPPRKVRRFLAGFPALAATLAIILLAVMVFGIFKFLPGRLTGLPQIPPAALNLTRYELNDISMVSPTEGWAVGNTWSMITEGSFTYRMNAGDPVILHYLHGRWTPQPLPDYKSHLGCGGSAGACPPFALYGISMASAQEGWAVGNSVLGPFVDGITFGLLLHYTGGKWVQVDVQAYRLGGIYMRSATDGWMIGEFSNHNGIPTTSFVRHYNGHAWTPVSDPAFAGVVPLNITGTADGQVWISGIDYSVPVGDGEDGYEPAALLHYDGAKWSKVDPHIANGRLYSLAFVSPNEGWAVGMLPNRAQQRPSEVDGVILHYHNGSWEKQTLVKMPSGETDFSLTSVAFVSPAEGWAVGQEGVIMHYHGGAWERTPSPTSEALSSVAFVSASEGWAIGDHGVILHYHNGIWSIYQG